MKPEKSASPAKITRGKADEACLNALPELDLGKIHERAGDEEVPSEFKVGRWCAIKLASYSILSDDEELVKRRQSLWLILLKNDRNRIPFGVRYSWYVGKNHGIATLFRFNADVIVSFRCRKPTDVLARMIRLPEQKFGV